MTICFRTSLTSEIIQWAKSNVGKLYSLNVYKLGISYQSCAIMVETNAPSLNKLKHITIDSSSSNGVRPVDSNRIDKWYNIKPIQLNSNIEIVYAKPMN